MKRALEKEKGLLKKIEQEKELKKLREESLKTASASFGTVKELLKQKEEELNEISKKKAVVYRLLFSKTHSLIFERFECFF